MEGLAAQSPPQPNCAAKLDIFVLPMALMALIALLGSKDGTGAWLQEATEDSVMAICFMS